MDYQTLFTVAGLFGAIGITTVGTVGGIILAIKNLNLKERRIEIDAERYRKELELAERALALRERETEYEVKKLDMEIWKLHDGQNKSNEKIP